MKIPEVQERKPDPGSAKVPSNPDPDSPLGPVPPLPSLWRRLSVVLWLLLCLLLLTTIVGATGNRQMEEAINLTESLMQDFEHPNVKVIKRTTLHTNAGSSQETTEPTVAPDPCAKEPTAGSNQNVTTICTMPENTKLTSIILPQMNYNADPCENFYNHACGGFIKNTRIPYEKDVVARYTMVADRLRKQLLSILSPEAHLREIMPLRLARYMYEICMNKKTIEKHGIGTLTYNLEKLGGWYLLEKDGWVKPQPYWSLTKSVKDLHVRNYTNDFFIDVSVAVDLKNTSRRVIYLDRPTLGMSREHLARGIKNRLVFAYFNSMFLTTILLGAEEDPTKQHLRDTLNFEIALANISLPNTKELNATTLYNPMSAKEMQSEYPYVNWLDYFSVVFKGTGITIDEHEIIIVKNPSYMKQLGPLMQSTSNRTLDNYVKWRVIKFLSPFLSENLRKILLQYSNTPTVDQQREECVDITATHLPIAVGAYYVKKYFNDESRRAALDMVKEIKNAFVDILKTVYWMDDTTRKSALDKVNSIVFHIGYPDELLDIRNVIEYYKEYEIKSWSAADYVETILVVKQFNRIESLKMLRQAVNKTDWKTHSNQAVVEAHYSSVENSIQIPAGLLQDLFLTPDLPRYMLYGSIGFIIGREITHACDVLGGLSDKNGNYLDWWQAETKEAYLDEHGCFIQQYYNYLEPTVQLRINGRLTAPENMADNGGMKVAYYAYKKWAAKNNPEPRVPSVELSPNQMFWLSAAQSLCSVYRPRAMEAHIYWSETPPDQFRVLGPMRNMVEFSEDFHCPSGSLMNPKEKCQIW